MYTVLFFFCYSYIITREKAICIFYCEPYSKARATGLLNGIEQIGLEVRYRHDFIEFFLYSFVNLIFHSKYHQYPTLLKESSQKQCTLLKKKSLIRALYIMYVYFNISIWTLQTSSWSFKFFHRSKVLH